ncbi:hypothetical protein Sango_1023900 [Sesamum angolense]|uniref:Uncharacterized protein n=1 Tax=Sesamum angolense TaxID=2727404 RepID=A0AAE1X037_9LAMI|nr:hypothetical protein Sango_1023900 [Sesamum angolense]
MYWPVTASEVMKANPGHYVSLIIPLLPPPTSSAAAAHETSDNKKTAVRFTRVKLLRPSDTLVLGRAYRLVTTQEVMKVLRAKKHAKMKKSVSESGHLGTSEDQIAASEADAGEPAAPEKTDQTPPEVRRIDKYRHGTAQVVAAVSAKHLRVSDNDTCATP